MEAELRRLLRGAYEQVMVMAGLAPIPARGPHTATLIPDSAMPPVRSMAAYSDI